MVASGGGAPIGQLARLTGTKVNTIRFYEQIGLMPIAVRSGSGRRTYGDADLARLHFIRQGRGLGFSISEIRSLLELSDRPDRDCAEASVIARRHLGEVELRITQLIRLRTELARMAESCAGGSASNCGIIEAIAERELTV